MKKYKKIVLLSIVIIMTILLIPLVSLADHGVPMTRYKVKVSNINGTNLIDISGNNIGNIPYNTELEITNEYRINGKVYGYVSYDNKKGYINTDDISILNLEIDKENKKEYIVFEKGAAIYEGPGLSYKKITEIPVETLLTVYAPKNSHDFGWGYTTYNGKSGWIVTDPYSDEEYEEENYLFPKTYVAEVVNKNISAITLDNEVAKGINSEKEIKIDVNTELKAKYTFYFYKKVYYWFEKDGNDYYIINGESEKRIAPFDKQKIKADKEIFVYDMPRNYLIKDSSFSISKDAEYTILYKEECDAFDRAGLWFWAYVEYQNKFGWVLLGTDYKKASETIKLKYTSSGYYEKYFGMPIENMKLENNTVIKCDYVVYSSDNGYGTIEYYGFKYNNEYYWVNSEYVEKESENVATSQNVVNTISNTNVTNNNILINNINDVITEKEEWNPQKYIIMGIAIVSICVLVAIIGLCVFNKNIEKKVDNNKNDNK